MQQFVVENLQGISFFADLIGIIGGIAGFFSINSVKKMKKRYLNYNTINSYNKERKNIKQELGAIQQILENNYETDSIMIDNKLKQCLSKLEFYKDIITDKRLKRYIKNVKKNKDIIGNLEKIKLICDREELLI